MANDIAFRALDRPEPLVDRIYGELRARIRSGAYAPGGKVAESVIARELETSRSPVREALWRLVSDGLLEGAGHGFRLPTMTLAAMEEISDLRRMLEPPTAARAAKAMTAEGLAQLSEALDQAQAADASDDLGGFLAANYAFRAAWVGQVANGRLRETVMRFDDQAGLVRRATFERPDARAEGLALLARGLAAFRDGDGAAAADFATAFIDGAAHYFRQIAPDAGAPQTEGQEQP